MATLVRIKRRLGDDPVENIVVQPKRLRVEAGSGGSGGLVISPTVLQRVTTLTTKDEDLQPEVLQVLVRKRKKSWDSQDHHSKLGKTDQHNQERLVASVQGCVEGEEASTGAATGGPNTEPPASPSTVQAQTHHQNEPETKLSKEDIIFYDGEIPLDKTEDIITCNGIPLQSDKYVYDIYYAPDAVDWTEYVCEIQKFQYQSGSQEAESQYDDEDDENEESNWRNDYPEEEDSSCEEDEEGYFNKQMMWSRHRTYDTDESFDAEEYDDDGFDEAGNLLEISQTSAAAKLGRFLAKMNLKEDDATDEDSEDEVPVYT